MALLKNIEELRKHIPFTMGMNMENMNSFIEQAEMQFIIPEIGQAAFDDLQTKYDNNALSSADEKQLLKLCQRSIAYYATLLFIPVGQLQISEAGIRIAVTEHFKQAFDWQVENLEESCRNAGDSCMESVLAFLELKKDVFTVWAGSSAYTVFKDVFVNSASQFNDLLGVQIPRRIFRRVLPEIKKVQENQIMATLSKELYDEIKTQWIAGNLTNENKALLNFIQPAIAHIGVAKSVSSISIRLTDLGISVGTNSIMKQTIRQAADGDARSHFHREKTNDGLEFISQLNEYLYANADTYPLFKNSSTYVETRTTSYNTDSESGFFVV
jgi:hypothetical protein